MTEYDPKVEAVGLVRAAFPVGRLVSGERGWLIPFIETALREAHIAGLRRAAGECRVLSEDAEIDSHTEKGEAKTAALVVAAATAIAEERITALADRHGKERT